MSLAKAFPRALREVRVLCCQQSPASAGTRQFVQARYPTIKEHNPSLPFLVREAAGTPARAFARFDRGVEKQVMLEGLSAKEVEQKISDLVTSGGAA